MALVLAATRATGALIDMIRKDAEVRKALSELDKSASMASRPEVTFLQNGLDGGTVNNESYARIIRRYPHVRFRLAIAMRISGPTWSKTRQHRPLMAWCQPICRHRPEAPDVSHIYWGIYQFQHVAEQFPQKGITQPRVVRNTPLSFDQAMLERDVKLVSGS